MYAPRLKLLSFSAAIIFAATMVAAQSGGGPNGCPIFEPPPATPTPTATPAPLDPCIVTGCSGQICADAPMATTCEWTCEYGCFPLANCERQSNGACGWTTNSAYDQCVDDCQCGPTVDPSNAYYGRFEGIGFQNSCATDADCMVGGCSGEVCAAEPVFSTCEVLPTMPNGSCGCHNGQCVWNDCSSPR